MNIVLTAGVFGLFLFTILLSGCLQAPSNEKAPGASIVNLSINSSNSTSNQSAILLVEVFSALSHNGTASFVDYNFSLTNNSIQRSAAFKGDTGQRRFLISQGLYSVVPSIPKGYKATTNTCSGFALWNETIWCKIIIEDG